VLNYKRHLILFAMCLGVCSLPMIFTATYPMLPTIGKDLSASVTQLQWIINIYGVVICSGLVACGRLADIYGRKRIYFIGISFFIIGMLISGLAPHTAWIIFAYALVGLGGAILIPVSQAIIANVYPPEERSFAIGILMSVVGLAMAIGPLFGGLIAYWLSWRWMYLIIIPFSVISALFLWILTPESSSDENAPKVDWPGVIFLAIAISCFVLAVIQVQLWAHWIIGILWLICVLAILGLVLIEKKTARPIVRGELFKDRNFLMASIANACLIGFFWSALFVLPLYLENVRHYSAAETGAITLFVTVPIAVFSLITGRLYHRFGPRILITLGFIFLLISAFTQMVFHPQTPFIYLMIATLTFGLGIGFAWSSSISAAMETLAEAHMGVGSGTFFTLQEMGGTVWLAITGTVLRLHSHLLHGYRNAMWILVLISVIGLLSAFFMRKTKA